MGKFKATALLSHMAEEEPKTWEDSQTITKVDIDDLIASHENFYNTDDVSDLEYSIMCFGLLQPVVAVASEDEPDKYRITAGHRRSKAIKNLVDKGYSQLRAVPTIIKPSTDNVIDRLSLIIANQYRDKTDWEKMIEVVQTETILQDIDENSDMMKKLKECIKTDSQCNRKRDYIAALLGTSPTQIGRFKAIYNHLSFGLISAFKECKIGVSLAYELSGLEPDMQEEICGRLDSGEEISIKDVKALKAEKEAKKPIEGQLTTEDIEVGKTEEPQEGQKNDDVAADVQESVEESESAAVQETVNDFKASPEYKDILCYKCLHYQECDQKSDAVSSCKDYINKIQSEKSEEQKYNEQQNRIDRETKKKLEEKDDSIIDLTELSTKNDHREPRDDFELVMSIRQFGEIQYGYTQFIVTRKEDYRFNDLITCKQYVKGNPTGKELKIRVKNVVQDCTGIEDKYCVVGFYLVRE